MFASILGPTCGVFLPPASVTHNQCAPSAFGCQAPHLDSMSLSGMRDNGTSENEGQSLILNIFINCLECSAKVPAKMSRIKD